LVEAVERGVPLDALPALRLGMREVALDAAPS
jgi:hypothetical protein